MSNSNEVENSVVKQTSYEYQFKILLGKESNLFGEQNVCFKHHTSTSRMVTILDCIICLSMNANYQTMQ